LDRPCLCRRVRAPLCSFKELAPIAERPELFDENDWQFNDGKLVTEEEAERIAETLKGKLNF
jgi:hypothetical protein